MKPTSLIQVLCGGLALAACGDDTSPTTGGDGGSGGAGNSSSASGTKASSSVSASMVSSSSAPATGQGGGGGGEAVCPVITIGDEAQATCAIGEVPAATFDGLALCTDIEETWPAEIFQVQVAAGDCVQLRIDDNGSIEQSDLFGVIIDPEGNNLLYFQEETCEAVDDGDTTCVEGALIMSVDGDAYIMAGALETEDCALGEEGGYKVAVSINGIVIDLSAGPACRGDLYEIIP